IQFAQFQKLADEADAARSGLRKDEVGGNHQSVQKGQSDWTFKECDHLRLSVNCGFARKPVLERGSRQAALFRKLPLGNGSIRSRFKLDDLRRGFGAIPSRLFWFVLAKYRIRLKHGFGFGGAVGLATTTLPELNLLVENGSATLLTAVGKNRASIFDFKERIIAPTSGLQIVTPWPKR
ncbi:MAG: hypothetical protein L0220_16980, partial [Acidobacteria bacterium]|nr:hypothetical protein [Acidobacteriota bacterium]